MILGFLRILVMVHFSCPLWRGHRSKYGQFFLMMENQMVKNMKMNGTVLLFVGLRELSHTSQKGFSN